MRCIRLIGLLALTVAAGAARADPAPPMNAAASAQYEEIPVSTPLVLQGVATPDAKSQIGPTSAVTITGAQDTSTATVKIGWAVNTAQILHHGASLDVSVASIALSSPLSKTTNNTNTGTLDGLANASTISFQFLSTISRTKISVPVAELRQVDQNSTICRKYNSAVQALEQAGKIKPTDPIAQVYSCSIESIREVIALEKSHTSAGSPTDAALSQSDLDSISQIYANLTRAPNSYAEGRTIVWGISAKVGYNDYSYYNATTLAKGAIQATPWQVGGALSVIGKGTSPKWALNAQYAYQRAFTEQTSQTLCPAGPGPVLKCVTGAIGAPKQSEKSLISLEVRWQPIKQLGLAPAVTYDTKSSAYSGSLPIYFVQGDSNALTGGLRADWASDKHHTVVGLFVTKGFSIGAPS